MAKDEHGGLLQTVAATLAGVIAVKVAASIVATGWRLATREDPPQIDADTASVVKKALWVALIGAATGAARQAARDTVKKRRRRPA
jgi:hypothetical protein